MTVAYACRLLGVSPGVAAGELRAAFRAAAKAAHPDRPGGDAERFRLIVEAHHVLQRAAEADSAEPRPEPARPEPKPHSHRRPFGPAVQLSITPHQAANGGEIEHRTGEGRQLRILVPAGLRAGDRFRAEELDFEVIIRGDGVVIVRGDDLWVTVQVEPKVLTQGGRVPVDTPLGRRVVIVTKKAAAQGIVRLQGQGLPPRGRHRQGHLFVRLEAAEARNAARDFLRRMAGGGRAA